MEQHQQSVTWPINVIWLSPTSRSTVYQSGQVISSSSRQHTPTNTIIDVRHRHRSSTSPTSPTRLQSPSSPGVRSGRQLAVSWRQAGIVTSGHRVRSSPSSSPPSSSSGHRVITSAPSVIVIVITTPSSTSSSSSSTIRHSFIPLIRHSFSRHYVIHPPYSSRHLFVTSAIHPPARSRQSAIQSALDRPNDPTPNTNNNSTTSTATRSTHNTIDVNWHHRPPPSSTSIDHQTRPSNAIQQARYHARLRLFVRFITSAHAQHRSSHNTFHSQHRRRRSTINKSVTVRAGNNKPPTGTASIITITIAWPSLPGRWLANVIHSAIHVRHHHSFVIIIIAIIGHPPLFI